MNKNTINSDLCFSRFIKKSDPSTNELLYPISKLWWSRLYEYKWASEFAEPSDVCLDAACGTGHHLKYYLATVCTEVYACDLDQTISNKQALYNGILSGFGQDAADKVKAPLEKINFAVANLTALPYEEKKFDKIYCISVIEHLGAKIIEDSLKEFHRVLKDDGIVVLTFDYPLVNLELIKTVVKTQGFKFACGVDFNRPEDAIHHDGWNLDCFRAVLVKN